MDGRGTPSSIASVLTAGGKAAIYRGRQAFAARAVDEITTALAKDGLPAAEAPALGTRIAELVLEPGIREILARETAPPGGEMPARPLVVVHDAPMSRIPWEALRLGDAVPALTGGTVAGQVRIEGEPVLARGLAGVAGKVGLVLQDPESQLTNLDVEGEVVFGPENLGLPREEIAEQRRAAARRPD